MEHVQGNITGLKANNVENNKKLLLQQADNTFERIGQADVNEKYPMDLIDLPNQIEGLIEYAKTDSSLRTPLLEISGKIKGSTRGRKSGKAN